jgi:hypothetical protein
VCQQHGPNTGFSSCSHSGFETRESCKKKKQGTGGEGIRVYLLVIIAVGRHESFEVEFARELEALIDLHHGIGIRIIVETLELELEDRRKLEETNTFLGLLETVRLK